MTVQFPDGTVPRLRALWRERLAEATTRYLENRTPQTRADYLRVLKVFADLVNHDKIPVESLDH